MSSLDLGDVIFAVTSWCAFGVNGGVDMVMTTMRLGVEEYITTPQNDPNIGLPSRALISLDICNIFNAVSHQKLLHLISLDFPELEPFANVFVRGIWSDSC